MKLHHHIPRLLAALLLALTAGTAGHAQMLMRQRNHLRDSLQAIMEQHIETEDYDKAADVARQVVAVYADLRDGMTTPSVAAKNDLAKMLQLGGHYEEAAEVYEDAIRSYDAVMLKQEVPVAELQQMFADCADCHARTGNYEKAIVHAKRVVERQRNFDKTGRSADLADYLFKLGSYCYNARQFSEANDYMSESYKIFSRLADEAPLPDRDLQVATYITLYYKGLSLFQLNRYEDAETALAGCEKIVGGSDDPIFVCYLFNAKQVHILATYTLGKEEDARQQMAEAEALYDKKKGTLGDMEESVGLMMRSIKMIFEEDADGAYRADYEEKNTIEDIYAAGQLAQKSAELLQQGDAEGAYELIRKVWNMKAFKNLEGLSWHISFLLIKTAALTAMSDPDKSEPEAEDMAGYMTRQLRNAFPYLTETERAEYWNNVESWYTMMLPSIVLGTPSPRLARLWYDAALQSKGILLNSTVNIERLLQRSQNEGLQVLQNDWNSTKNLLRQAVRRGEADKAEELRGNLNKLEKRVLREVAGYGNIMDDLFINTDSVRRALKPSDVAVEFVRCMPLGAEEARYLALTLRHDYDAPHLVDLFEETLIEKLAAISPLGDLGDFMWSSLWQPIVDDCDGTLPRRIFFAADGLLYNLPVEYCTTPQGSILAEAAECYRLSSTRELARRRTALPEKGETALFGGIDYDAGTQDVAEANTLTQNRLRLSIEADAQTLTASRGTDFGDTRKAPTGLTKLKGAKMEVDTIAATLRAEGITPWVFDSCRATKESVEMVTQTDLRILHFATHGLYIPRDHTDDGATSAYAVGTPLPSESESLSRSALAMAGANRLSRSTGDKADGYLTAYDISLLDLGRLDLAVLSACESGLGDVSGEGVFGLQRGFKKAGTRSLLMSLNKVNDHTTNLFMKTFYHSYIARHKTKREALIDAIRYVRTAEGGQWDSVEYWAPFILLDGL